MSEFEMYESIGLKKEFAIYLTTSVLISVFLYYLPGNMKQAAAGTVFIGPGFTGR